jgi:hypothetical protein
MLDMPRFSLESLMFWKKKTPQPQIDLSERIRRVSESILENESLTGELEDAPAKLLLDWALSCTREIVQGTGGLHDAAAEEAMAPRLKALRQMLRSASRLASSRSPEVDITAELNRFYELAGKVYGRHIMPSDADQEEMVAGNFPNPQELIARLRTKIDEGL